MMKPLTASVQKSGSSPKRHKWVLRKILAKTFVAGHFDRPKQGFVVPMEHWLRVPLREWASDLLSPGALSKNPYLDADKAHVMWMQHHNGEKNWQASLWRMLVLQSWLAADPFDSARRCR